MINLWSLWGRPRRARAPRLQLSSSRPLPWASALPRLPQQWTSDVATKQTEPCCAIPVSGDHMWKCLLLVLIWTMAASRFSTPSSLLDALCVCWSSGCGGIHPLMLNNWIIMHDDSCKMPCTIPLDLHTPIFLVFAILSVLTCLL
jgi:hypothetical protein